jgi:hypothetical protein
MSALQAHPVAFDFFQRPAHPQAMHAVYDFADGSPQKPLKESTGESQ